MSNCNRCGKPLLRIGSICQECESIEREREQSRESLDAVAARIEAAQAAAAHKNAAAQAAAAHKIANPGEYDCPTCGYKTLKFLALRCPICQADTPSGYWTPIIEGERVKAEAVRKAQEEWDRAAPARVAAAKAAKEEGERTALARAAAAIIEKHKGRRNKFWFYLLPAISIVTFLPILYMLEELSFWGALCILLGAFVPILNWLSVILVSSMSIFALFTSQKTSGTYFLAGFIFWAILGGILLFVNKPKDNPPNG